MDHRTLSRLRMFFLCNPESIGHSNFRTLSKQFKIPQFSRYCCVIAFILCLLFANSYSLRTFTADDIKMYREKVRHMFIHAYDSYSIRAFPYDELQPISCKGMDTWGSFSLTLIDALDTLAVMRNYSEFKKVVNTILSTADFNVNINVSVFETNIRVVGGLLSAHLLSKRVGLDVDPGWPCSGPLLDLAEKVARKLLPAFNTTTGMPYGTVNLKYGVPEGETPITCTAGVSTFLVEFGTLSHLTGDPVFQSVAANALESLWLHRSSLGLVGNHINVQDGKWTALDAGIGGGVDSYFEYLVKGAILFQEPKYLKMFQEYKKHISKHMMKDDWYFWVSMSSGHTTMPTFQSLEAFWPGLLTLTGDIDQALKTLYNYHTVWKQYGFTPEIYDVAHNHAKRENYPLRPELIESVMYLYYATKDHHLLEIGVDILESIEHSAKTECGYATIKNVLDHKIEDRMESFFLAETTKYLYLLFDPDNFIHNNGSCGEIIEMSGGNCVINAGGYVFNTEAHPIDIGAVHCCSSRHYDHQVLLEDFQKTMDLHSLLEIRDSGNFLKTFKNTKTRPRRKRPIKVDQPLSPEDASPSHSEQEEVNVSIASHSMDAGSSTPGAEGSVVEIFNFTDDSDSSAPGAESDAGEGIVQLQPSPSDAEPSSGSSVEQPGSQVATADPMNPFSIVNTSLSEDEPESLVRNSTTPSNNEAKRFVNASEQSLDDTFFAYELLSCPAQPFSFRFMLMGEMFNV